MRPRLSPSAAAVALLGLSACMDGASAPATASPAAVQSGVVDGIPFTWRRVAAEPDTWAIPVGGSVAPSASPAIRIGGVGDLRLAGLAMGSVCGIPADRAADWGAYGDPVARDPATGEFIFWLACDAAV